MKKIVVFACFACITYFLEACAPPASSVTTTPAPTTTSSGGIATLVEQAAQNQRLLTGYENIYNLLQRRNAGENVDEAVAALPEPSAVASPTGTARSTTTGRTRRRERIATAHQAPTPAPVAPPSSMMSGAPTGPTFRAPITNVIGNVAFAGPTPWDQDGAMVGRSEVTVALVNMQSAVEIVVNGRRVCASADGVNFPQIVTPSGQSICVVPPMSNITNEIRLLVSDEGARQVFDLRRWSYNSYVGVGRLIGSCRQVITPSNALVPVVATSDYECH